MSKGSKNDNIWHKDSWYIIEIIILFIFMCVCLIYTGIDKEYLSVLATLFVGLIACCQNECFAKQERKRYKGSIQPILSVKIINKNDDGERSKRLFERDSISYELSVIEIKNVGKYPGLSLRVLFMDEEVEMFLKQVILMCLSQMKRKDLYLCIRKKYY